MSILGVLINCANLCFYRFDWNVLVDDVRPNHWSFFYRFQVACRFFSAQVRALRSLRHLLLFFRVELALFVESLVVFVRQNRFLKFRVQFVE